MATTVPAGCVNCGSRYELIGRGETQRDKDSVSCEVCGWELHSWNAAVTWEAKLIERKENHLLAATRSR